MAKAEIECEHCKATIRTYYSKEYHGKRGKCDACGVDFPLE